MESDKNIGVPSPWSTELVIPDMFKFSYMFPKLDMFLYILKLIGTVLILRKMKRDYNNNKKFKFIDIKTIFIINGIYTFISFIPFIFPKNKKLINH